MTKKQFFLTTSFYLSAVFLVACDEKPHGNYNYNPPVILSKKDAGSVKRLVTGAGTQRKVTVNPGTKAEN